MAFRFGVHGEVLYLSVTSLHLALRMPNSFLGSQEINKNRDGRHGKQKKNSSHCYYS